MPVPLAESHRWQGADRSSHVGARVVLPAAAERLEQLNGYAQDMRREPTAPEKRLWRALSRSQLGGHKFRRQSVIGPFIADFMCPQKGLVVEVDGHTHADPAKDAWRDTKLNEMGFRVFRVSNSEIMHNLEGVCEGLLALLAEMPDRYERPHPNPSPEGEGLDFATCNAELFRG